MVGLCAWIRRLSGDGGGDLCDIMFIMNLCIQMTVLSGVCPNCLWTRYVWIVCCNDDCASVYFLHLNILSMCKANYRLIDCAVFVVHIFS